MCAQSNINVYLGRACDYCGKPLAESISGRIIIKGEVVSEPLTEPVLVNSETARYFHSECERDD